MLNLDAWRKDIEAARERLQGRIRPTPLRRVTLSSPRALPIWIKPENRQITGSFKLRGATNALSLLSAAEREKGVVTASAGNHGRALAHVAAEAHVRASIFVSSLVPENKLSHIRAEGAELHIAGSSQDAAERAAREFAAETGQAFIPAFDNPAVIAGQGTLGFEILDDLPDAALVVVALSGGGLAAGLAAALKSRRADIRVVGVTMERGAAMHASIAAGHPVEVEEVATLADALGGGIGADNRYTFAMVRDLLDDTLLVSENEIAAAIRVAAGFGETVEGAGAVGLAAVLFEKISLRDPTVVVLSGGNIDPALHRRILAEAA